MKNLAATRGAAAAAILLAAAVTASCGAAAQVPGGQQAEKPAGTTSAGNFTLLTIGTADSGGSMYAASSAIAAAVTDLDDSLRFNISASTGSYNNIENLMNGELDLALVSGEAASAAYEGRAQYSGHPAEKLRAVGAVYLSSSNWMTAADSGLVFVHDLKGGSAAVGPENSATDYAARTALTAMGITDADGTFVNAGLGSGADMAAEGKVQAVHGFAGAPIPGLSHLADEKDSRLLLYTEEELEAVTAAEPAYFKTVIPAGTYRGQKEDVQTFGTRCILCVGGDTEETLVYHIAELLDRSRGYLSEESAILSYMKEDSFFLTELPVPLHPGAEKYYKEQGLLK